jgi:hypothetical protein
MLLAGVLNLVNNLLSGLGLDGLLKGIISATVCFLLCIMRIRNAHDF